MKTRLYKFFTVLFVSVLTLTGFTGCGDDITEQYFTGAEATNYTFDVNWDDWGWDENNARYECYFDFKELNSDMYKYGSMMGGVFVEPGTKNEWLEMLPYSSVHYYTNNLGENIPFTVNISCAFTPGQVGFFLSFSDREWDDNVLESYKFRVTLVWDEYNYPYNK